MLISCFEVLSEHIMWKIVSSFFLSNIAGLRGYKPVSGREQRAAQAKFGRITLCEENSKFLLNFIQQTLLEQAIVVINN
jgi:hypothetical protein